MKYYFKFTFKAKEAKIITLNGKSLIQIYFLTKIGEKSLL